MWVIVGDDGASGDDRVFTLTSLSSGVLVVQCGDRWGVGVGGSSFFPELSFGFVRFVSMSQYDRQELFFFSLSLFFGAVVGHYCIVVPTLDFLLFNIIHISYA